MEQKQIDEIEDSYKGEEFIDEDDLNTLKPETKVKRGRPAKKTSSAKTSKTAAEKSESPKKEEVKVTPVKEEAKEVKSESKPEEQVKTESVEPVIDPWDDEEESSGGSFWKMLTGILLILLLISIFTNGFNFSEGEQATGAAALSLSEAETQALDYVNTNLLQQPFQAELSSSEDVGSLYMVRMSVAGQEIDSYITKDGKLFFPQGFDTTLDLAEMVNAELAAEEVEPLSEVETIGDDMGDDVVAEDLTENTEDLTEEVVEEVELVEETPAEETTPISSVKEFTINAKRWLFSPNELTVSNGDTVRLEIVPEGLDFTFAIPELGVEQQVSGITMVEFTTSQAGSFSFSCSSCEDWRGMSGNLLVE